MGIEVLAKSRVRAVPAPDTTLLAEEVTTPQALTA
jgi:hypothetical protein